MLIDRNLQNNKITWFYYMLGTCHASCWYNITSCLFTCLYMLQCRRHKITTCNWWGVGGTRVTDEHLNHLLNNMHSYTTYIHTFKHIRLVAMGKITCHSFHVFIHVNPLVKLSSAQIHNVLYVYMFYHDGIQAPYLYFVIWLMT